MGVGFAGRKSKGSAGERELLNNFWSNSWGGLRCAGSGSARHPVPDILVSNGKRVLAFEVKVTKDNTKYFSLQEIEDLRRFAGAFGAHPMVAVKFKTKWYFINADDLRKTARSYVASVKLGQTKGLTFENLLRI
ncbi:Holliday junction resolvase Hjc [Nanoarchaeota archaeon]